MSDNEKTKAQLVKELQQLRQRVAELEHERQQAAQAQASEHMLRSIIDATPDWIFIKDQEHRYRLVNQGYANALHLQPDDFIGKNDLDLGFPEELVKGDPAKGIKGFWADDRQVMDSGEPLVIPQDLVTIDDELRVFHTIKTPLRDAQGEVWGALAFARDVTEREKLLTEVQASEQRLRSAIDATPDWVFVKDQEHRYRMVNQSYADSLNLTPSDFIGKNDLDLGFPEELVKGDPARGLRGFWTDDRQVMDSGEPLVVPREIVTIGEQSFIFNTIKVPLRDAEGQVWGVLAFARDMTERENLLEQVTARQEHLAILQDISRALNAARDADELLHALVLPAQRAGASGAVLMYIDLDQAGEPEWLNMTAMWQPEGSAQEDAVPADSRFYLPDFIFSSLWMSNPNETQLIADVTTDERIDENFGNLLAQTGSRALVTVPLTQAGRWVGIINFSWEEPHEFSPQEAEIYAALAGLASPAIDNHRLAQQTEVALAQTEALYNASQALITASTPQDIIQAIAGPLMETGLGVATLFYLDSDAEGQPEWIETKARVQATDGSFIPIGTRYYIPEFPLSRLIIVNPDHPMTIRDVEQHEDVDENSALLLKAVNARSLAAIPLTLADPNLGRRWLGVIMLAWPEPHEFSPQELRLYDTLAPQLTTLIENQRLLEQIQQRAVRLQTAAQVSRAASSILDPDELLQQVVGLVRQQFGLYYVGLFLTDPSGQWAVLRSGTGEAGRLMVEQGHRLEIGGESMIGSCIANVEARIALDVGEEAVRFDNPHLPRTRSEMALPLVARGQAIGAITVQSVEQAAFSPEDITTLQSMADQLANAIENARLFEQTQITLSEARQSERLLRSIIDATPDLIFVKDPAHNFQLVNRSFASALGLAPQEFIGKNDIEVGFAEERVKGDPEKGIRGFWDDDDYVLESGETLQSNENVSLGDQERIMNFAKMALRDEQEEAWGLLGIGRDVTEREQLFADLERRSQDLQTAAEVSSTISSILDPDELNQQVVDLVQKRFDLYYAGLFLVDQSGEWSGEPNKWAVLRAGSGEAGRQMLKQRHKLEIGGESMIGSCIASAQARIALDVGEEAVRFDNPHLPHTRSEMALPLVTRGQAIGAMSIQSEKQAAFTDDDIAVLQTMADQVATAIQNGRLYQESIILYMASQAISQAETIEEALAGAARYVIGSVYDTCALLTFVQPGQHDSMEVLATWKKSPDLDVLPVGAIISQRRFPMYNTIACQETIIFNDMLHDERISADLAQRIQQGNVRSSLSIPLAVGADWLGLLLAQSSHPTALGAEDRRAFEPLAHQLAAFIRSARLLEETQQALEEVQRLHRSYISEAWQEYLSSSEDTTVADYLLEQQQVIPRPELKIPEIERALEQNRIIVGGQRVFSQSDSTEVVALEGGEEHSIIVAPISLREQVIGTLGIHDPSGQHTWDEDDIALLEAVSIQLGLAIDNARLAEQTQRSLAETQTLFDTSRNLAAAQGIEEIQQAIVEAARSRRMDACALLMFDTLERETANDLVLTAAWDSQETPRLPAGARLPLKNFELFDNLQPDQPYAVPDLTHSDVDEGTRNLMTALGFAALLHQPIAVRDRWFGFLTVLHEMPHEFSRAEINFYRTLVDQAALALEGQRLLIETQQRAEREQLIRQVTEKVHDTPDMETILQTTVQELSKAMGLPRVFVRLGTRDTLSQRPKGGQTE
jgi:PAS domain S-box-containing protein